MSWLRQWSGQNAQQRRRIPCWRNVQRSVGASLQISGARLGGHATGVQYKGVYLRVPYLPNARVTAKVKSGSPLVQQP
jgi:hypothetical protein